MLLVFLLAELFSAWRERSGKGKAGALFKILIHNLGAREDAEAVFLTFPGRNPLKSLVSEK
jgi:hypothetical protein